MDIWLKTRRESVGNDFAAELGCTDPSQVLPCMRSKLPNQVLLALPSGQQQFAETSRAPWGPVVDGLEIPDQPRALYENGSFNHVPVIVGATRDEGWPDAGGVPGRGGSRVRDR